MREFIVNLVRHESRAVTVVAESAKDAIAKALAGPASGFRAESVESADGSIGEFVVDWCEACGTPLFDSEDYRMDEDLESAYCTKCADGADARAAN